MKRFFDIVFSLTGIIILIPVYLLIAFAISIDSKGGVIYKQKRTGKANIPFDVLKFRTMRPDSFAKGALTVGSRDPRITGVGYYLRKYKLDELPQLFNVLFGEMSFVGPRPEVKKYTDLYNAKQLEVLSVRPGITDYASIKFRNENDLLSASDDPEKLYIDEIMPEKLKLNLNYIHDNNVFKDIKIIFDTFVAIIKD
ncbi:MAG: glycosyl transferase [Chryseobacterium sp. 39-10]|nr:sugar transferase [Chryseobacterium sp.]OJV47979.1 MAG: glycosyl transferase [Chryseobacterium sp. 39-10]